MESTSSALPKNLIMHNRKRSNKDEDGPSSKVLIQEKQETSLLMFCNEILFEIFKHVDTNSLFNLGKVDPRIYTITVDHRFWRDIDLTSKPLSLQEIYRRIQYAHTDTRSIIIRGLTNEYPNDCWNDITVSNTLLKRISGKCCNLKIFEVHEGYIDLEEVSVIDFPNTIKRLVFNKCFVSFPKISNAFFTRIDMYFPFLEELVLENCNWFETHDLIILSKIPGLKKLSLRGCENLEECVPYGSIATRFGFKKLEVLDVRDTPISDSDIQCFNITYTLKVLLLECPENLRDSSRKREKLNQPHCSTSRSSQNQEEVSNANIRIQDVENNVFKSNDQNLHNPSCSQRAWNNGIQYGVFKINPERDNNIDQREEPVQGSPPDINRVISRSIWFERRYPPPFSPPRILPISDRGICSFGCPPNHVPEGIVWIRAEIRPPNTHIEKLVIRHYKQVTDVSLIHLAKCTPNLVYLDLTGTSVTKSGVENFKKEKPLCVVISDPFTI